MLRQKITLLTGRKLHSCAIGLISIILGGLMCSCQPDGPDGPDIHAPNFGTMRLKRMNLDGAKQLALKKGGNEARSINGEYLSAGLYKINADGQISAVAVYFTTDSTGNKSEKEYALKVAPLELESSAQAKDYIIAKDCEYYDADGDIVTDHWLTLQDGEEDVTRWIRQDVPYKNLLIRKTDGKIWCIDNIMPHLNGTLKQDKNGVLYCGSYRFNLSSDPPTYEELFPSNGASYNITDNGVFWDLDGTFNWPHIGYQKLDFEELLDKIYPTTKHYYNSLGEEVFPINTDPATSKEWDVMINCTDRYYRFVARNDNTPGVIFSGTYSYTFSYSSKKKDFEEDAYPLMEDNIACYYDISIGDAPGSVTLKDDPIILSKSNGLIYKTYKTFFGLYYWPYVFLYGEDYAILFERIPLSYYTGEYDPYSVYLPEQYRSRVSKIDFKTREWKIIKTIDFDISKSGDDFTYTNRTQKKIWKFSERQFGSYWFDYETLEDGFIKFDVTIPSWMDKCEYYIHDRGYIRYSGINPANYTVEEILIDITTGEATTNVEAYEYTFETIISLN